jgi:hypothetical protein
MIDVGDDKTSTVGVGFFEIMDLKKLEKIISL